MTAPADWQSVLRRGWSVLRPTGESVMETLPLGVEVSGGPLRVGIDKLGRRHLLVPSGADDRPERDDGESIVTIGYADLGFAGVRSTFLDVVCSRADLVDLFNQVLDDVIRELSEEQPDRPATTAARSVKRWRLLFEVRRHSAMSLEGQLGIFGELEILKRCFADLPIDISMWRGPLGEPHDILLPACAVEVKAVAPDSQSIHINGLEQLNPPEGRPLILVVVSAAEDQDGTTLQDCVDEVEARATDPGLLRRRLAQVGFLVGDERSGRRRFTISQVAHLLVQDPIPRIVPSSFSSGDVPIGVGAVTYAIDLGVLTEYWTVGEVALIATLETVGQ